MKFKLFRISIAVSILVLLLLNLLKPEVRQPKYEDNNRLDTENGEIGARSKSNERKSRQNLEKSVDKIRRPRKDIAMDVLNPFGQQVGGNRTYTFYDYFDYVDIAHQTSNDAHTLAVIVPFRKAEVELARFLPHMKRFLNQQNVKHSFFVVDQVDTYRFNRASLVNVGFLEMAKTTACDYFAIHDVDLVPLNPELSYRFDGCQRGPLHLAPPSLHPLYSKVDFLGAILLMTNQHYIKINGMSNTFWGWGREDEEFRIRIRRAGLKARFRLDTITGLSTTRYELMNKTVEEVQGVQYSHFEVKLKCDMKLTPWCKL